MSREERISSSPDVPPKMSEENPEEICFVESKVDRWMGCTERYGNGK